MATDKKIIQQDQAAAIQDADAFVLSQSGNTVQAPARSGTVADLWTFFNPGNIRSAEVTIATADVLTLNATPITIVSAPGAGLAIDIISASATLSFNSAAYTTNGILQLRTGIATDPQAVMANTSFLFGTVSHTYRFDIGNPTAVTDTQILGNQSLLVEVDAGDPAAGDSDIIVRVLYRLITI